MNHSIPDSLAVAVRTPAGTILHTGDFKMDQLPLDGRLTDLRAFARLGEAGVDLFMVDSTNAEVPGFVTPERDISPALERVFAGSRSAGDRGLLRLPRAPGAAGARRGGGPRPQGGLRRPVDGPQHGGRARPGLPQGARQHLDRAARHRRLRPERSGDHLHRFPRRAALRAVPDGQPGSPGDQPEGRGHRGAGQLADPGQRERGLPGDQRSQPARSAGGAQGQRAGARVRARRGRGVALRATTSCGRAT